MELFQPTTAGSVSVPSYLALRGPDVNCSIFNVVLCGQCAVSHLFLGRQFVCGTGQCLVALQAAQHLRCKRVYVPQSRLPLR